MGPLTVPENCCSESGTSTGLIEVRVEGVTQEETEGGQKPSVENDLACKSPGRASVVFFTDAADPKIAYRVHVSMEPGALKVEALSTPERPDPQVLKLSRKVTSLGFLRGRAI